MFGGGWAEMFVIGIVALVVIGPKDLPIVMRKIGRVVGTVRRMGGEFQRELNKTTGLDQITDLRRTLTEPLRQTSAEIMREFNKTTETGVEPTGVMKPTDPKVESVYDQIAATSGVAPVAAPTPVGAPASLVSAPMVPQPSPAPAEASVLPPAEPSKPKRAPRAKTPAKAEPAAIVTPTPTVPKPRSKPVAAKPAARAKVVAAAAPKKPATRSRAKKA